MKITVLIPTHGHARRIRFAIQSLQRQTHPDWELMIVGDGAESTTLEVARAFAATDSRISVFEFPKGERRGEAHRHTALQSATGEAVCYLSDDDLWAPQHLEEMAIRLVDHDYVHVRPIIVLPGNQITATQKRIEDPDTRRAIFEEVEGFWGLSSIGHRLDFYRRMAEGWAPAPPGIYTDLHMSRKILATAGVRAVCSPRMTVYQFPAPHRRGWTEERAEEELELWSQRTQDALVRAKFDELLSKYRERRP